MKKTIFTIACFFIALMNLNTLQAQSNVGIGTATPEASAKLDVNSTTQGFLPPRMTEAQRDAIISPATGLMVYCTDCGSIDYYNGVSWVALAPLNTPFQGTQQGIDIDGEAAGDQSGEVVSLSSDGSRVAIGARQNGTYGHVRVYEWTGGAWVQMGTDIEDTAPAGLNQFGHSLSLSGNGNRLIVGAYLNNNSGGSQAGHAQVFEWNNNAWVQLGNSINGSSNSEQCGHGVSINEIGTRIVVGSPQSSAGGNQSGHVRIFDLVGNTWTQVGQTIPGEATFNYLGRSKSISLNETGDRVALGSGTNSGAFNQAGHVRIFELVGTNWVQLGTDLDGLAALDRFGSSVSLDATGTRVAIGAPDADVNAVGEVGAAYVYQWSGTAWVLIGNVLFGGQQNDVFGTSVSISANGQSLAVGAPTEQPFNPSTLVQVGKAYYYDFITNNWSLRQFMQQENFDDEFGKGVSISNNGVLAVGAPGNAGNGSNAGSVRVFR